eukprot:CAMPEP_0168345106 /NCGR_PEP_ID=MMETSP0213-20121227/17319_1 /TAXON_ID=151035 /ORGANISM="Euplotes harpa, Strain FSP1.4" /LENGTH=204 /DNA_ID=CAMNT_0008353185 /DNA_START=1 /DNA_END=613 /DNA_ORIENTATION=-
MFNKSFLEELFKPQERHSYTATKHLFTKLAHSSVMKLNENSMSKLFDLMVMGVKFQIISTTIPEELYHVTMKHWQHRGDLHRRLQDLVREHVQRLYGVRLHDDQAEPAGFLPRQTREGLAVHSGEDPVVDGTLNIFYTGIGPIFSQKPGKVTYYNKGKVRETDELTIESAEEYEKNPFTKRLQGATDECLGMNMYAENRGALCS